MQNGNFVTSVLQPCVQDVMASTYHTHNSMVKEHLRWIQRSHKIKHMFGVVDATDLNSTAATLATTLLFDRVVFCYPIPTTNGDVKERQALIEKFFDSVRNRRLFDRRNGQIILGLKSSAEAEMEDYQLDDWNDVDTVARSAGYRLVATRKAIHGYILEGKKCQWPALEQSEAYFDDQSVRVKFYAFESDKMKKAGGSQQHRHLYDCVTIISDAGQNGMQDGD